MALSDEFDTERNARQIITDALQMAGIADIENPDVSAALFESSKTTLNKMLAVYAADGVRVWKRRTAFFPMGKGQREVYITGSTWLLSQDDKAALVATATNTVTLEGSVTEAAIVFLRDKNGNIRGIQVDALTPAGQDTLVTLHHSIVPADYDVGSFVYYSNSRIGAQPSAVERVVLISKDGTTRQCTRIPMKEFYSQTYSSEYVWTAVQTLDSLTIRFGDAVEMGVEGANILLALDTNDIDQVYHSIDFPQYWYEAITAGLARRMAVKLQLPLSKIKELKALELDAYIVASSKDTEFASFSFEPDLQ